MKQMLATHNHTNTTRSPRESDIMAFIAFLDELGLAENIILIFFSICTILGNTLVLVATWRESSLHQPNKYFIACLAVADLLVGIILEPLRVYYQNLDYESLASMSILIYVVLSCG